MQLLKEVGMLLAGLISRLRMAPMRRLLVVFGSYVLLILSPVIEVRGVVRFISKTFASWMQDRAPQLAAGLAYYAVFALAPSLIIIIAVAGLVFEAETVRAEIVQRVEATIGAEGAEIIDNAIETILQPRSGPIATIIGVAAVLFGAAALLGHIQVSLNIIWEVRPHVAQGLAGLGQWLRRTLVSFVVVVISGFLLVVFLVLNTVVRVLNQYVEEVGDTIGISGLDLLSQLSNTMVLFIIAGVLFAIVFRSLPDTHVAWQDVWLGASVTSGLFLVGQDLIQRYITGSGITSIYGAAGAVIALLIWVYYSAQIFLFGAELTKVYAYQYGSRRKVAKVVMLNASAVHRRGLREDES